MSRIKGHYISGTSISRERWLDPKTGDMYESETASRTSHSGFVQSTNGEWTRHDYVWAPDAAPELAADWYVMRMVPDDIRGRPERAGGYPPIYTVFGPYTEAEARDNAALRSEKSGGRDGRLGPKAYAVFQIAAGNTVVVQPPAPPAPVTIWS